MENFGDDSLKCGRSSLETKHHDYRDEYSLVCDEDRLLLAVRMHPNLVISTEPVKEAIDLVADHDVRDSISERQRKCICDGYDIEFSIIDAYPDRSIFLGYYDNWTQPRDPLDRANEPDFE